MTSPRSLLEDNVVIPDAGFGTIKSVGTLPYLMKWLSVVVPQPTLEQIVEVNDGFKEAHATPVLLTMLLESKSTVVQGVFVG